MLQIILGGLKSIFCHFNFTKSMHYMYCFTHLYITLWVCCALCNEMQCDWLCMAMCFWHLAESDLCNVRVYIPSIFTRYQKNTVWSGRTFVTRQKWDKKKLTLMSLLLSHLCINSFVKKCNHSDVWVLHTTPPDKHGRVVPTPCKKRR